MAVEAEVVVGREIEECASFDDNVRRAARRMALVERIAEPEPIGDGAMLHYAGVAGHVVEPLRASHLAAAAVLGHRR